MENEIEEIDIDMIKRMRREGDWEGADKLLEAFRNNCEKQWKTDKSRLDKQERDIKRFKGICISNGCKEDTEGDSSLCKYHRNYYCGYGRKKGEYSPICKYDGCERKKRFRSSYCDFHKFVMDPRCKIESLNPEQQILRRELKHKKYMRGKNERKDTRG